MRASHLFLAVSLVVCAQLPKAHANQYEIEARPIGPDAEDAERLTRLALKTPRVRSALNGIKHRVLATEVGIASDRRKDTEGDQFAVQVYDYTNDKLLTITAPMDELDRAEIASGEDQLVPTYDEFSEAVRILEQDSAFGPALKKGELVPYQAMPALLDPNESTGKRVIPVGLRPTNANRTHEILGVDMRASRIERFTKNAPPGAIATAATCGPQSARQRTTRQGTRGMAEVSVKKDGVELWKMKVVRASASSGRWGSGVELRDVQYKGTSVLARAHVPILNVDYEGDICGPFRDQVNEENAYISTGRRITTGIQRVTTLPQTIFDTKTDRGNFWGVSIYESDSEFIVMSELSAGWYRYVSEYRFLPDGTIKPYFRFSSVHNSCTCRAHVHHLYWRFDFDIAGKSPNSVAYQKADDTWAPVATEEKQMRDANHKAWRVFNPVAKTGYEILPGPSDGTANEFGKGDVWILKYGKNQLDDGRLGGGSDKYIKIDAWLNDEPVANSDIVFWYGGHLPHANDATDPPQIVGPTLKPFIMK